VGTIEVVMIIFFLLYRQMVIQKRRVSLVCSIERGTEDGANRFKVRTNMQLGIKLIELNSRFFSLSFPRK